MGVSIGGPMFLIVVGAILYWATDFELANVDMNTVGLILLIAGVVTLIFSIAMALFNNQSRGGGGQPPPRY
jgi:formate hydrogenlyase subunit 3/multisubunit Na+/H+ antiporter MnhD subunit